MAEVEESDRNSKKNREKIALINKKVEMAGEKSDEEEVSDTESSEDGSSSGEETGTGSGESTKEDDVEPKNNDGDQSLSGSKVEPTKSKGQMTAATNKNTRSSSKKR